MFINLSNHPSAQWVTEQLVAAENLGGKVVDVRFPNVDPDLSTTAIADMADKLVSDIPAEAVVMLMGEFSLTYALTRRLRARGTRVVVACTRRESVETQVDGKTVKTTVFRFLNFRDIE